MQLFCPGEKFRVLAFGVCQTAYKVYKKTQGVYYLHFHNSQIKRLTRMWGFVGEYKFQNLEGHQREPNKPIKEKMKWRMTTPTRMALWTYAGPGELWKCKLSNAFLRFMQAGKIRGLGGIKPWNISKFSLARFARCKSFYIKTPLLGELAKIMHE